MPSIKQRKPKYQKKPEYADALMWNTANQKEFKRFISNHRKCYIHKDMLIVIGDDGKYVLKAGHYLVRTYERVDKQLVSKFSVMHYEEFEETYVRCQ